MNSFLFALEAVLPITIMVAIGYILKLAGLFKKELVVSVNKLVFRVFLPVLLFLNVYKIKEFSTLQLGYIFYALAMILTIFFAAIPVVMIVTPYKERRGPIWQASFRSNYALVGIPLASAIAGQTGEMMASFMSALVVPLFNVLAVISLSVFSKEKKKISPLKIICDIIKNPLIQAIFAASVLVLLREAYTANNIEPLFKLTDIKPVYKCLEYLGSVATPLALISLGAQFEFSAIKGMCREIITGTIMRVLVTPLLGIACAMIFFKGVFGAAEFACFVSVFATPTAVSSVPMSQEMGNDSDLAGQLVVWTTILSAFSMFISIYILRIVGIF